MMRSTFTVVAKGNAVMLQAIVAPPRDLFNELARESRAAAKAAGMRPSDITAAGRPDTLICGSLFLAGDAPAALDAVPWPTARRDPSEWLAGQSQTGRAR